ncbi:MAG: hypothetical protein KatS3mg013_1982 [Actinomycetota bacterium]|jgi:hypothetical protein|nr:MAG: hypothetical protein KatS3mg013_1982 [Actinomycetota bacterium]
MAAPHTHEPAASSRPGVFAGLSVVRAALTLAGAAAMIVGAFLRWTEGTAGTRLDVYALWRASFDDTGRLLLSAGAVAIALGLLAILGLAPMGGGLTRLAGALGVVAFVLVLVQLYRADATLPDAIGPGLWLLLVGSIVVLVGGFVGGAPLATPAPDHVHG